MLRLRRAPHGLPHDAVGGALYRYALIHGRHVPPTPLIEITATSGETRDMEGRSHRSKSKATATEHTDAVDLLSRAPAMRHELLCSPGTCRANGRGEISESTAESNPAAANCANA